MMLPFDELKQLIDNIIPIRGKVTVTKLFFKLLRLSTIVLIPVFTILMLVAKVCEVIVDKGACIADQFDNFCQKYDGTIEAIEKENMWGQLSDKK